MKTWQDVLNKTKERRKLGDDESANKLSGVTTNILFSLANDSKVQELSNTLKNTKELSQTTISVGITKIHDFPYAVICKKGSTDQFADIIAQALVRVIGPIIVIETITNNQTGLHAEMAILRHFSQLGISKYNMEDRVFIMCIGKPVCKDCAGYMNSQSIGHCSLVSDGSMGLIQFSCGSVSTMGGGQWEHPFTGSVYIGGNNINSYQNKKMSQSLNQFKTSFTV
ncbi:hypothetical protein MesoLjLc_14440 [Mesorhizobium sp. L-8-10]|nr:hypothetical protein [Mesorhizobium sp. L-8-3]BCH21825.1 hypothetical protein MesoLjLb_16100 [Mesorhizobium sp. L-8-3]BCH29514.1 hypothetical protein MesoLjLc_14440 [Mesorhizobium sp. L-8-10]